MYDPGPRWSQALSRTPWATILPLLAVLPFMLSGAVRFESGTSFETSLALPAALTVMAAGWVWTYGPLRVEAAESRVAALGTLGIALLLVGFSFELWWTPLFGGLPNTFEGVDVGNHLLIYQRFIKPGEHRQYQGFVSLYALMHWYRVLLAGHVPAARSYYQALRFAHYAFLLVLPVAIALVAYPVLARVRGTIQAAIASVASLPVQLASLGLLLFPAVQYYQAEGFYSQIAGLYPVVLSFLSYGLIAHAGTRFVLCCFWLVVQRYTYGLNMGDSLLALAYLWLWDARQIRAWWLRWGAWAFVPVAIFAATRILRKLWPLRLAPGYFIHFSAPWALGSILVLSMLLLLAPGFFRERGIHVSAASERFWRYAAVQGMATGVLLVGYYAMGQPPTYYSQKFALYASVLLAIACVGPVTTLVVHVIERGPRWLLQADNARLLWGATAFGALALFAAVQGYLVYWPMARERWKHIQPSVTLYSNYEPEVEVFIEQTLRDHKAEFGGYYDPFWPRTFTHNALHFFFSHARDHYFNGDFVLGNALFHERPGLCFFVQGTAADFLPGPQTEMGRQITKLYDARNECTKFHPGWSERPLSVCASCL